MGQHLLKTGTKWGNFLKMMDKLGQALLQTGQLLVIRASAIAKLGRKFVTNWATLLQYGARALTKWGNLILSGIIFITKWNNFITKWGKYYNKGQLLQSWAVHLSDTWTNSPMFTEMAICDWQLTCIIWWNGLQRAQTFLERYLFC